MAPLGLAIAGAIGLVGAQATIVGSLINIGIAAGLSYVSRSLTGAPAADTGLQTTIELGGDQPRGFVVGEAATAGQLLYANTANENNNLLQMVYAIGEGPHDDLTRIWVNGKARNLTLVEETVYHKKYRVSGFVAKNGTPLLYVYFYRGYQDQPVCQELVDWAKPSTRWTSADRLAGVAHVVVSAFYGDSAFDSGIPRFLFGVRGRRLYDWRLDSTNGGSGAHRWTDEKTWTFSANPIVQTYNFERGLYLNGELVVGKGTPPVDLLLPLYTAGANACDEPVSTIEGSDANRYVCSTVIAANEEFGAVIERLLDSCAGSMYDRAGANGPLVGVPQTVAYPTITDGDLVVGYPVKFRAKQGRDSLVNGIFGSYASPNDQYEMVSYPAQTDAGAESADTEVRRVQVDFPQVPVCSQAQRLAKIRLRLSRLQATATITLPPRAAVLEPGDWVRWNSARRGDRTFMILNVTENVDDQTITLSLREIASSAFSWSTADQQPTPVAGEENDGSGLANSVTGFSVLQFTMVGDAGAKTPAVRVFWSPISDPTVTAVLIQYRIVGSDDVLTARAEAVGAGEALISAGLVANTAYEFQATIETAPARATEWTAWVGVTTGEQLAGGVVPNSITPAQMTAETRNLVVTLTQAALTSLQASVAQLALIVADVDSAGDLNKRELARSLTIQLGAAVASFNEQIVAAVGPDSAIVAQITELQSQVDGIGATLNVSFVTEATPAGALAAFRVKATAQDAAGGLLIVAKSGPGGVNYSEVWIDATRFLVTGSGADPTPVFLIDTSGPSPVIVLDGDVLAPESITAGKLDVATLSAIVANLGEVIAGVLRNSANTFRVDATSGYLLISSS